MTKRQMPDLSRLLSPTAVPMTDAATPPPAPVRTAAPPTLAVVSKPDPAAPAKDEAATANLENLNFKVPKSFRKRFRDCAYQADLKHNELLFAALDAWEILNGKK
jgi:hypothetical protein